MSDFQHTDSKHSTPNTSRRRVLQAIGGAGVVGAIGSGGAAAQTSTRNLGYQVDATGDTPDDTPISTQFWTYNENSDLSVAELIRESADAGYDAVEPFQVDDQEAITTALEETGIGISSAHVGLSTLEDNFEETVQMYSDWGADYLIHPYEGSETWNSEQSILDFTSRMNEMADRVAEEGLQFGYHNHDHEFVEIDDRLGYDIFAQNANSNVSLQIDAGWVLVGGQDPIEYIDTYSDSVSTIHMKNMTADGEFREINEGDVSMRAVANIARNAANVDYLIYEYDAAPNPLENMQTGANWLEQLNNDYNHSPVCGIEDAEQHPAEL